MKKVTFLFFLLTISYGYSQTFPIDFTDPLDDTFVPFNGATATLITDPTDALNDVLQIEGCACDWDGASIDFGQPLNLSDDANNTVTFRINPLNGTGSGNHLLKFEMGTTADTELPFTTSGSGWQNISVDFGPNLGSYGRMSLFTDAGNADLDVYLFDDFDGPPHDVVCAGGTGAIPGTDFTLVWADEFSVDGAPCADNWDYDLGGGGWGNGEAQTYTSNPDNVIVENGILKIIAKDDGAGGYTSARLKSQDKYEFTYGKVEISAKLPIEDGTWSALWMLGADFPNTPWPAVGEIDIMEHTGNNENVVLGTVHNTAGSGGSAFGGSTAMPTPTDFHKYSIIWDENEITFYVDDVLFFTYNPSPQNNDNYPYTSDFFLIMNVAMGGTLGGAIDPAFVSGSMEVDYVRVYQKITAPQEPDVPAPTPTRDAADVISMFSDAYTDVAVDTWRTPWSVATYDDTYNVAGNATKKYTDLDFVGIETVGPNLIDASGMTHFHLDIWTPDANEFKVKLVDFGADESFDGGDDTEHEINFGAQTTGSWISYDIPLSDFTGLVNTDNIAQLILVNAPLGTLYVDNVYFYNEVIPPTEPDVAAPDPLPAQSEVINMYSNSYTTDVGVSSWRSAWSTSTYTDNVLVDGMPGTEHKRYIDADFVGVEFYGADAVDASAMNYFHVDVWSPNATVFRVKLVEFDPVNFLAEAEIAFNIPQGEWVQLDIPFTDFEDSGVVTNPANTLTSRNSIQQLIFSGQPVGTFDFFIDNVYFSKVSSLGINDESISGLSVFPNPSRSSWNVRTNNVTINSIQVFDVLGKQVIDMRPNAVDASIDATSLNSGLYFARINAEEGTETVKLIKQ